MPREDDERPQRIPFGGVFHGVSTLAVVGGGIIGLSIAWRMAQRGWGVFVYDRFTAGAESSWAGAGMLAPGGEVDEDSELASLAIESRGLYTSFVRELEHDSQLEIDYQECGALDLAYSGDEMASLEARATVQASLGISSKLLTSDQVQTFWPRVRSAGLAGARFYGGDGIVNPRDVVAALVKVCRGLGVSIVQNSAVERIEVTSDSVALKSSGNVKTFSSVVLAAGAWSSDIQVSGVPALPSAEPVKGHLIGYQQPDQTCNTILRHGHSYLLQRASGLLVVGASVERVGFDRAIAPERAAELGKEAGFVLPHLAETTPSETWIGFRPGSDRLRLGAWHSDRFYLAYGHYRNGILLAPITAQRMADEIISNSGRQ